MVTNSLSERRGAGPGRSKIRWIIGDPFIASSTMVKMVVRTVAFSSICSALLVCVVYTLKHTTVLFPCQQLAQCVIVFHFTTSFLYRLACFYKLNLHIYYLMGLLLPMSTHKTG